MFSRRVSFIIHFFDFWGSFTEYSYSPRFQQVICIVFMLHICFAVFSTLFIGYVLFSIKSLKLLDKINEFVQYQYSLYSYYIFLIESYLHRQEQRSFWKIYEQIDDKSGFKCHSYSRKLIEFFVVVFAANVICIYLTDVETNVWIVYTILSVVNHVRLFYYIFYLELLKSELKFVEKQIREMIELSRFSYAYNQHRNRHFKDIRIRYSIICDLIDHLNEIFSLSNFSTMLYHFLYLFSILNYAYLHLTDYSVFYHAGKQLKSIIVYFFEYNYNTLNFLQFFFFGFITLHVSYIICFEKQLNALFWYFVCWICLLFSLLKSCDVFRRNVLFIIWITLIWNLKTQKMDCRY